MSSILAVDIGGTFTDLVAYDLASGEVAYAKSPTNYDDLVAGIFECVAKAGVDLRGAEMVKHGTTSAGCGNRTSARGHGKRLNFAVPRRDLRTRSNRFPRVWPSAAAEPWAPPKGGAADAASLRPPG